MVCILIKRIRTIRLHIIGDSATTVCHRRLLTNRSNIGSGLHPGHTQHANSDAFRAAADVAHSESVSDPREE